MKNKTFIILGGFAAIPMFLATMVNMVIATAYWLGNPSESMKFYMGQCNNKFVSLMDFLGLIGMAFVLTAVLIFVRYADKIDRLDDATQDYIDAKKEMEKARDKYTKQLISDNK